MERHAAALRFADDSGQLAADSARLLPQALRNYPAVLPFAITSNAQFAPNPPPAMTSAEYARRFQRSQRNRLGDQHDAHRRPDSSGAALGKCQHSDDRFVRLEQCRPHRRHLAQQHDGGKRPPVRADEYFAFTTRCKPR
ncbi:MAG: hypothetical protein WKF84_27650 [Pyrinomonadaceae bacterium]